MIELGTARTHVSYFHSIIKKNVQGVSFLEELTFSEAMVGTSCWNNSVAHPLPVYERAGSANAQKEDKKQHTDESQFIKIMENCVGLFQ